MGQVIKLVQRKVQSADPFSENEREQVSLLARQVTLSMADVEDIRERLIVSLSSYRLQLIAVTDLIDGLDDPDSREILLRSVRLAAVALEEDYRRLVAELDSLSRAGRKLIAQCNGSVAALS